ncbi:MAG: uncharacterized protein QG673_1377 [Pseudomonadota bacterium]|nr:uncharacterized protein [Pseudomonadota bacterium]
MQVEVTYAIPAKQVVLRVDVLQNQTSVLEAIYMSKINAEFPELDLSNSTKLCVGIFGKKINLDTYHLQPNDRIEIYRPLCKTPNERRLERAKNHAK